MKKRLTYYTKYGTNSWSWIDGKLLEDTNKALLIKNELSPNALKTFEELIDEL